MSAISRRSLLRATTGVFGASSVLASPVPPRVAVENVNEEIRRLASEAPLRMKFRGTTAAQCRQWQRQFSGKLRSLLGPFAPPRQWHVIVERVIESKDHRRTGLILEAEGYPPLPVYLLEPRPVRRGRRPGVVALHGHGPFGNDAVVGIATTGERRADIRKSNYDYGLQLVRRGYVVAAPCFVPFGRRLDDRNAYGGDDPCAVTFVRLQLLGKVLMAENLRDALWSLELLARTRGVDAERLGCVGLSYGGRMTMLTTALDRKSVL